MGRVHDQVGRDMTPTEGADAPYTDGFFVGLAANDQLPAVFWRGQELTYRELLSRVEEWTPILDRAGITAGTVCAYVADFWPHATALGLALMRRRAVVVPFSPAVTHEIPALCDIAAVEHLFTLTADGDYQGEPRPVTAPHPIVEAFRATGHPGAIVFTSGSSGRPKGILHDFEKLLAKFQTRRRSFRTLMFLLPDHLGGINTLLSVLANGGTCVVAENRSIDQVVRVVEQARVELLPVTPALLSLLLSSGAASGADLSSVRLITYGTDAMHEATLRAAVAAFPQAKFKQTYGLSEVGVLHSESPDETSTRVRIGGHGFETRIVEGVLHIRSHSSMVGYLNAPSPFDADGWLNTGDAVLLDGDALRILGRESDLINVGGQKVFPAEVENVLLQDANVVDVTVSGERHPLMGSVVVARVQLRKHEEPLALRQRLRRFCLERLAPFKVPVKFRAVAEVQISDRFKKTRRLEGDTE